jgi:hypothetical protein
MRAAKATPDSLVQYHGPLTWHLNGSNKYSISGVLETPLFGHTLAQLEPMITRVYLVYDLVNGCGESGDKSLGIPQ